MPRSRVARKGASGLSEEEMETINHKVSRALAADRDDALWAEKGLASLSDDEEVAPLPQPPPAAATNEAEPDVAPAPTAARPAKPLVLLQHVEKLYSDGSALNKVRTRTEWQCGGPRR
jgi:hypothetical protein